MHVQSSPRGIVDGGSSRAGNWCRALDARAVVLRAVVAIPFFVILNLHSGGLKSEEVMNSC